MANEDQEDVCYMDVQEYAISYMERNQILRHVHIANHCFGDMFYGDFMEMRSDWRMSEQYKFKLDCASSLADLGEGKYNNAAEGFLKLIKDVNKYDYSEVLSSEDVVAYGLLCAMANFDQDKLREALQEVIEPLYGVVDHLKEIIHPYSCRQFATCMKLLEKQKPRLCLDIYLCPYVESLVSQIKDVAVAGFGDNQVASLKRQIKELVQMPSSSESARIAQRRPTHNCFILKECNPLPGLFLNQIDVVSEGDPLHHHSFSD
ncbi:PREDICTED: uncharacterized protein LOC104748161 [Camelina sativa]|uniref:Uncharacterized protein LOC104748161 n=1 Tax=Camelina sativa TaxID=90675 RepID=A0ABM0WAL7_CAMSA|nr:PREDICTED: uncharacterized protein LOC104748161 [Camelina sativa]